VFKYGFKFGQRVRVNGGPADGIAGNVARIMFGQQSLWVRLDRWPDGLKPMFTDEVRRNWLAVPIAELSFE
jgi:hypothetical protein